LRVLAPWHKGFALTFGGVNDSAQYSAEMNYTILPQFDTLSMNPLVVHRTWSVSKEYHVRFLAYVPGSVDVLDRAKSSQYNNIQYVYV